MLGPNYSKVGSATASPINAAPPKTSTFDFRRDKKKEAPLAATALTLKSASEAKTEKEALEFLEAEETLLSTLKDLFLKIQAQKKRTGIIGPQQFVTRLRKESGGFRSSVKLRNAKVANLSSFRAFPEQHASRCPRIFQLYTEYDWRNADSAAKGA